MHGVLPSRRPGRHSPRISDSCEGGSPVRTGSATINRESRLPGERAESPPRRCVKICWSDSVRHLGASLVIGRLSAFPAYFPDGVSLVATFGSTMSRRIGADARGQFASMPSVIWQMPRDGSERKRHPAAAEPGHCRLEWPSGIAIFTWSDGQSGERGQYELSLRHLVKRIPERVVAHPRALYAELEQPHRNPHAYPMMLRGRPDMTTSDVVHVMTGLEVGGAEMLLLELCREDIRHGRTPSVASLMSDGPMRDRFAKSRSTGDRPRYETRELVVTGAAETCSDHTAEAAANRTRLALPRKSRGDGGDLGIRRAVRGHGSPGAFSAPFRISPAIRHGCAAPSGSVQSCRHSSTGFFTTAGSLSMPISNSASVRGERSWFQTASIWTGFASTRYRARRFAGRWACPTTRSR